MMYDDVHLNEYGFYSLKKLPSDEERKIYYKERYYQEAMGSYEVSYTEEEICFFKAKLEQKLLLINQYLLLQSHNYSFLDIRCGEGFALAFFKKRHFHVLGLDYSIAGIEKHNPDVINNVILGDIDNSISKLIGDAEQFDIINMDNLLEHVTDPKNLLQQVHNLLKENGIVIIKVPNDFSYLQKYFWQHNMIKKAHWVAPLDHISYFNKNGLISICRTAGLDCIDFLSDRIVEFYALNPNTNYFENKKVGKSCYLASLVQENILHDISPAKAIKLYRVLGEMGLGRNIIGVFKQSQE